MVVPKSGQRGGGVAAQLVEAEEVGEVLVQEGVPLGEVGGGGATVADPGDHGQADVRLQWKMLSSDGSAGFANIIVSTIEHMLSLHIHRHSIKCIVAHCNTKWLSRLSS